ncbi:MAG: AEC family transporter [Burkholderiales bacterium]|nr:AEC family transporter [Burkholderiales bacterium]
MQAILAVTVPFFGLVLCGGLAARAQVLPADAIPGLNVYVLYFALPCLLFRFGAATPVLDLLNPALLGVYLVAAGLIVLVTVGTALGAGTGLPDAAFGALVAAFPNTGFMGVPLLVALMGPAAAGPVICTVLADLFVTSSLCIALAQAQEAAGRGPLRALAQALRAALSNPLPWAIALGAACSVAGVRLSGPLDTLVHMLADSASPVALFTIGAVLGAGGARSARRTPLAGALALAAVKLFVHPLLVGLLAAAARRLGASISVFQITVLTLAAALPSASNVALLAQRYGADIGRVARVILLSTALAFVSFTLLAVALGARPR